MYIFANEVVVSVPGNTLCHSLYGSTYGPMPPEAIDFQNLKPQDARDSECETKGQIQPMQFAEMEKGAQGRNVEDHAQKGHCSPDHPPESDIGAPQRCQSCMRPGSICHDKRKVGNNKRRKGKGSRILFTLSPEEGNQVNREHDSEDTDTLQKTERQHLLAEQRFMGIAWRTLHDAGLLRFSFENDGAGGIDDELEKGDMNG